MEAALISLLLADASISALAGTRINWNIYPQGVASPAIRLSKISGAPGYHMQGSDGLESAVVQIDARALSPLGQDAAGYEVAFDVAAAVKALLSDFRGTSGGTVFGGVFLSSERQYAERADSGELFHVFSLDFSIWSRAAV